MAARVANFVRVSQISFPTATIDKSETSLLARAAVCQCRCALRQRIIRVIQRKSLGTSGVGIPKEIWLKHFPETSDDKKDFAFVPRDVVTLKGCPGRYYRVIEGYYAQVDSGMNKMFENWYRLRTANGAIAYWKEYQLELV